MRICEWMIAMQLAVLVPSLADDVYMLHPQDACAIDEDVSVTTAWPAVACGCVAQLAEQAKTGLCQRNMYTLLPSLPESADQANSLGYGCPEVS